MLSLIILFLARLYGNYIPIPYRKWQICMEILSFGRIHPWKHTLRWRRLVEKLPPRLVSVRGFFIMCDWQDSTFLDLLLLGDHEPYTSMVIEHIIRSGDVILDIGANIGYMSLLFALNSGPCGRVFSYEPVSTTIQKLYDNIERNATLPLATITVLKKALGDHTGTVPIYLRSAISGTGIDSSHSSIIPDFRKTGHRYIVEEVDLARLDEEQIEDRIAFVKCDVEGAEKSFFNGGRITLSRDKPIILFEWNPEPCTYSVKDMISLIRSIGDYEFFRITRQGLFSMSVDKLETHKGGNVLCAIRELHYNRLVGLVRVWRQ